MSIHLFMRTGYRAARWAYTVGGLGYYAHVVLPKMFR